MLANNENLVPNNKRTPSERRENAKKAGIASGKARKEKKALKDCMEMLLNLPPDSKTLKELQDAGIDGKSIDNRTALTYALLKKAMKYGNVLAFQEIRDLIGEKEEKAKEDGVTIIDNL